MDYGKKIGDQVNQELDVCYGDGIREAAINMVEAAIKEAFRNCANREDANKVEAAIQKETAKHWREWNKKFI